jgi:thiol-disulfide isomerase/thioredoxin
MLIAMRLILAGLLYVFAATAGDIIAVVRAAIAQRSFALGEKELAAYRARQGITPEMLEALSWLGRGALAARSYDQAEAYAAETRKLALAELKSRTLDAEPHLPIALGASIEVQAQVMAGRGERDQAVAFLRQERDRFEQTSLVARIQKNINLLSLEGKPAPPLEAREWLGTKPLPLDQLKGRPVLLFFWAHWCGDCKSQVPILAQLAEAYGPRGLMLIGPTQHYGYTRRGEDATPPQELSYIDEVRKQYYARLANMPVPVSETNFREWGCSTTPTLVLIDGRGIVRYYHPGNVPYAELASRVEALLGS